RTFLRRPEYARARPPAAHGLDDLLRRELGRRRRLRARYLRRHRAGFRKVDAGVRLLPDVARPDRFLPLQRLLREPGRDARLPVALQARGGIDVGPEPASPPRTDAVSARIGVSEEHGITPD